MRIGEKKTSAQAFLLLAQAHRKQGRFDEALKIMLRGVKKHPNWASAHILLGAVYADLRFYKKAIAHLKRAIQLAPEATQAYKQLGDCFLLLKKPVKALAQYKKVLLMAPRDQRALQVVQKLESLTAADYDDELFEAPPAPRLLPAFKTLQRFISLADAHIMRNDRPQAIAALNAGEQQLGPHPELTKRLRLLSQQQSRYLSARALKTVVLPPRVPWAQGPSKQIQILKTLLKRINTRCVDAHGIGMNGSGSSQRSV